MRTTRNKVKLLFFVFMLLFSVIVITDYFREGVSGQEVEIKSFQPHRVERIIELSDKSFILEIDGKLYRALDGEAMQKIVGQDRLISGLTNALRECDGKLRRRNEAE